MPLRTSIWLLFSFVCFAACSNSNKSTQHHTPISFKQRWYKHYTGTIAGQPVAMDISCNGFNTASGTYYYTGKSELIYIALEYDTATHKISGIESVMTDNHGDDADEDVNMNNTWNLTSSGDSLTGLFHKDKGGPVYDILLREDYSNALMLDYLWLTDSVLIKGEEWDGDAITSYIGIAPAKSLNKDDAAFIDAGIVQLLNYGDSGLHFTSHLSGTNNYKQLYLQEYLNNYRKNVEEWQKTNETPDPLRRFEQYADVEVVYNSHGLLALGNNWWEYSGGAHANKGSAYINIDIKNKRILTLDATMNIDSAAISAMLEKNVRFKNHASANTSLNDILIVNKIAVTGNIIISGTGITFCYSTMTIATIPEGDIKLFLPYSKLRQYLKPEFIKRMGLKI